VQLADNSGVVSGTPATSGNFSFAVSVSDTKGASKQQTLQMTVANAAAPAPYAESANELSGWAERGKFVNEFAA